MSPDDSPTASPPSRRPSRDIATVAAVVSRRGATSTGSRSPAAGMKQPPTYLASRGDHEMARRLMGMATAPAMQTVRREDLAQRAGNATSALENDGSNEVILLE